MVISAAMLTEPLPKFITIPHLTHLSNEAEMKAVKTFMEDIYGSTAI